LAHTTPVYVSVDGGGFHNPKTAGHYLDLNERYLVELENEMARHTDNVSRQAWRYREGLQKRIDEARGIIRDLRARFPKLPDEGPGALAALPTLRDGWHLATEGHIPEAVAAYAKAQELDPSLSPSANVWRTLCWNGSVRGRAAEVLDACERLVELTPAGGARDVRGLARALTGDVDGAVADFEAFVAWTESDRDRKVRQEWIEALRRGENPFTPELLESLRGR